MRKFIFVMNLCVSCLTIQCSTEVEFVEFSLDVSDITTTDSGSGTMIISHNAIAAFPLNLHMQNRVLTEMGPSTIIEAQTLSACSGSGRESLPEDHEIVRNIDASGPIVTKDVADIRSISLEMPYTAKQDTFTRVPGSICVGFHIKDTGWIFTFTPNAPELDDDLEKGFIRLAVDEKNVDIIAILFDATTNVEKIMFEARKSK